MTPSMHNRIVRKIQRGESVHVETQSARRSIHEVEIDGKKVRVVYVKRSGVLITVLR